MKRFAKLIFCFLGIALSGVALAQTATFVPNVPSRFVDTKPSGKTIDGQFQAGGLITGGTSIDVPIAGRNNIPATGVGAVALNITVTNPASAGFLVAYPKGVTRPTASNLNFAVNQSISNAVVVKLGTNGAISLFLSSSAGSANVVVDVTGYFPSAAEIAPLTPARLLDTRAGTTTVDSQFAGIGAVGPNGTLNLTVLGRGGVPSLGVAAVVLNVTATNTTAPSYITTWPTGASRPLASSINFVAGQTMPNLVVVAPGTSGQISLYNAAGSSDLIADVVAYFPSTKAFTPVVPARLLDTRAGATTIDTKFAGGGALATGATLNFDVLGRGPDSLHPVIPATGVNAVALNVTVTGPTGPGFLTAWGTGTTSTAPVNSPPNNSPPNAAMLTFDTASTISSLIVVPVGPNGQVSLYNGGGTTQVIADVIGWFTGPYDLLPMFETRNTSANDTFYTTYYNDLRYALQQGNVYHGIAAFIPCAPDTITDPTAVPPPPPFQGMPGYPDPPGSANNHGYGYDMTLACAKPNNAELLYRFYQGALQTDHVFALLADTTALKQANYHFDRAEGYVFQTQVDQTVPLYELSLGAHPATGDVEHRYTVSNAARQGLINAGWTFERVIGYVFPTYTNYTVPANSAATQYNGTLNGIPLNTVNGTPKTGCPAPNPGSCQITNVPIQNVVPAAGQWPIISDSSKSTPASSDRYGIFASNSTVKPLGTTRQFVQFTLYTGSTAPGYDHLFGGGTAAGALNHFAAYLHYSAPATKDKLAGGVDYEGIGVVINGNLFYDGTTQIYPSPGQIYFELQSAQNFVGRPPVPPSTTPLRFLTAPLQNNATYKVYYTLSDSAVATVNISQVFAGGIETPLQFTTDGTNTTTTLTKSFASDGTYYTCPLTFSVLDQSHSYCGNPASVDGFNPSYTGYLFTPILQAPLTDSGKLNYHNAPFVSDAFISNITTGWLN